MMELIERYLYAVCKNLPSKSKKDIEDELRSSIMDALDAKTDGNRPSEEDVISVLKEFGPPKKVARNYSRRGTYLVGPELYDLYMLIVKIALIAGFVGVLISFIVDSVNGGGTLLDFLSLFGRLFSLVTGTVGTITIVFAIAERINPDLELSFLKQEESWNPKDLDPIPQSYENTKLPEVVVNMIFTILFLILINFYSHLFGIYTRGDNNFIVLVDLEVLKSFIPFINGLLGLSFIKSILLLKDGRYKAYTFVLEILGALASIVVIAFMLSGPSIIDFTKLDQSIISIENTESLKKILSAIYRGILAVCGVAAIVELIKYSLRFSRRLLNKAA